MSETINIIKISRPSREGAVSPSLTRASFSGGFYFYMESEISNTASSSRSKKEQTFITKAHAYNHGKFVGFIAGTIIISLLNIALDLLLIYLNLI